MAQSAVIQVDLKLRGLTGDKNTFSVKWEQFSCGLGMSSNGFWLTHEGLKRYFSTLSKRSIMMRDQTGRKRCYI